MTKATSKSWDEVHAERVAYRRAHNGQPNGYRPVSEAELQAQRKELFHELEPTVTYQPKIVSILDPNFGKIDTSKETWSPETDVTDKDVDGDFSKWEAEEKAKSAA